MNLNWNFLLGIGSMIGPNDGTQKSGWNEFMKQIDMTN